MNMETKKIYVRPAFEAIDMDVCVLEANSFNQGGGSGNGTIDPGNEMSGAPGYQGPIDDTPVSDDDM